MSKRKHPVVSVVAVLASVAVSWVVCGPAAFAADSSDDGTGVPGVVRVWFDTDAAGIAENVLGGGTMLGDDDLTSEGTITVGEPAPLYDWNETGLTDDTTTVTVDELVEPARRWIATLYRDGTAVGTITAAMDEDGHVIMDSADDDKNAGEALEGEDHAYLVDDPELGGVIALDEEGSATGLSPVAADVFDTADSATEVRDTVVEVRENDLAQLGQDEMGASSASASKPASGLYLAGGLITIILIAAGTYLLLPQHKENKTRNQ